MTSREKRIAAAEQRVAERAAELDHAAANDHLREAIKEVPPIREQIQPSDNQSAFE